MGLEMLTYLPCPPSNNTYMRVETIGMVERTMQEDFGWAIGEVCGICESLGESVRRRMLDLETRLDPMLMAVGWKAELNRFRHIGGARVLFHEKWRGTVSGAKTVKVKWVRVSQGGEENAEVHCHLVEQELWYGERVDDLFVRSPSLPVVKALLSVVAERDLPVILLDVKRVLLHRGIRRNVYIELSRQHPRQQHDGQVE